MFKIRFHILQTWTFYDNVSSFFGGFSENRQTSGGFDEKILATLHLIHPFPPSTFHVFNRCTLNKINKVYLLIFVLRSTLDCDLQIWHQGTARSQDHIRLEEFDESERSKKTILCAS